MFRFAHQFLLKFQSLLLDGGLEAMGLVQLFVRGLRRKPRVVLVLQVVEMEKLEAAWAHALVLILFRDRQHICCFIILFLQ